MRNIYLLSARLTFLLPVACSVTFISGQELLHAKSTVGVSTVLEEYPHLKYSAATEKSRQKTVADDPTAETLDSSAAHSPLRSKKINDQNGHPLTPPVSRAVGVIRPVSMKNEGGLSDSLRQKQGPRTDISK